MTKPFFTYEQQIRKLIDDKKLIINDLSLASNVLKTIGYFPVIGGIKHLLLIP